MISTENFKTIFGIIFILYILCLQAYIDLKSLTNVRRLIHVELYIQLCTDDSHTQIFIIGFLIYTNIDGQTTLYS